MDGSAYLHRVSRFNLTRVKPTSLAFHARRIVPTLLIGLMVCAPVLAGGTLAGEVEMHIEVLVRNDQLVDDFDTKGDGLTVELARLERSLLADRTPVYYVSLRKDSGDVLRGATGCPVTIRGQRCYVLIDAKSSSVGRLATLIHEIGHLAQVGHVVSGVEGEVWAETIAWLALRELGVDNTRISLSYLHMLDADVRRRVLTDKEDEIRQVVADTVRVARGGKK